MIETNKQQNKWRHEIAIYVTYISKHLAEKAAFMPVILLDCMWPLTKLFSADESMRASSPKIDLHAAEALPISKFWFEKK